LPTLSTDLSNLVMRGSLAAKVLKIVFCLEETETQLSCKLKICTATPILTG
jgi:hypothetical protein